MPLALALLTLSLIACTRPVPANRGAGAPAAATGESPAATMQAVVGAARSYAAGPGSEGLGYLIVVEAIEGDWARVKATAPDPGSTAQVMYLRRSGGAWQGVAKASSFSQQDYLRLGIPPSVQAP